MAFLSYSRLINNSLSFATFGLFSCNRYSKKLINQTTRKTKIANSCSLYSNIENYQILALLNI